jgi:hypothetical protein
MIDDPSRELPSAMRRRLIVRAVMRTFLLTAVLVVTGDSADSTG